MWQKLDCSRSLVCMRGMRVIYLQDGLGECSMLLTMPKRCVGLSVVCHGLLRFITFRLPRSLISRASRSESK